MTEQLNLKDNLSESDIALFKSKLDAILKEVVGIDDTDFIRE